MMKPGHDRSQRRVHDLGDLPVAVANYVGVVDHHPESVWQRLDRFDDRAVGQSFECLDLCRAVTHRTVAVPWGVLPVRDYVAEVLDRPTQGLRWLLIQVLCRMRISHAFKWVPSRNNRNWL